VLSIYNQILNILNKHPETEKIKRDKLAIYHVMGIAHQNLGFSENSHVVFHEGKRLSEELDDKESLHSFSFLLDFYYSCTGNPSLVIERAKNSFKKGLESNDIQLTIGSAENLWVAYLAPDEDQKSIEVLIKAINFLDQANIDIKTNPLIPVFYADFCGRYAEILSCTGDLEKSEVYCKKAHHYTTLNNAEPPHNELAGATTENNFGLLYLLKGYGKLALERFQKSLTLLEEINYLRMIPNTLVRMGNAYAIVGDFDRALESIERGLKLRNMEHPFIQYVDNISLAEIQYETSDYNKAALYAEKALEISKKSNIKWAEGKTNILLGCISRQQEKSQIKKAEAFILYGITKLEEVNYKWMIAKGYSELGELYRSAGRKEDTINALKKAELIFVELRTVYYLARIHEIYHLVYKDEGDFPKSRKHLIQAIDIMKEFGADGWVERYEKELAELT